MKTRSAPAVRVLAQAGWCWLLGVVSGLACVAARLLFRLLQWCFTGHDGLLAGAAGALPLWHRALVPVMGALCAWAVQKARGCWADVGPSTNYIQAIRWQNGMIPFAPTLWRTIASAFSVATGAAVGREGSMIQFAAAATSWLAQKMSGKFELSIARQVACGAAAAVAAVYQAPIAGVFFASEIVLEDAALADYPLLLIGSLAGWLTGGLILGHGPLFAARAELPGVSAAWLWLVPLAMLLGVAGMPYQWLIRSLRSLSEWPVALAWSGLGTGLLSLASTEVWGNGDAALLLLVHANGSMAPGFKAMLLLLVMRLCATAMCVGAGTVGGVFTPTLFTGAAAGLLMAHAVHTVAPLLLILIGLGALLAAVTQAPIMASFMAVELTGRWELLPAIFVCNLIAWQVAVRMGSSSLYDIATTMPGDRATRRS